jgi:hypothetical protein
MDREDPEKRIAELERRLRERGHRDVQRDVVAMPVSSPSPAQRCFVATAARVSWKWGVLAVYGFCLAMLVLPFVISVHHIRIPRTAGESLHWLVMGTLLLAFAVARSRRWRSFFHPQVFICRSGDDIVVTQAGHTRSFPIASSTLGPWAAWTPMGTALHLRNGRRRFVLGGQNHSVLVGVRLDARQVSNVNAYMSASDFDALLTIVYRYTCPVIRRLAGRGLGFGQRMGALLLQARAWLQRCSRRGG